MGRYAREVRDFIESVKDDQLMALPSKITRLYANSDFCLDMQGFTTEKPQKWSLEVRPRGNKVPQPVAAAVLVPVAEKMNKPAWSPREIKDALIKAINV